MYRQRNTLMAKVGAFWLFCACVVLLPALIYIIVELASASQR